MKIDGACLCGSVRYEAEIEPDRVRICHCNQCQINSASPYRYGVLVHRDQFRLLSGELKFYVKTAESGQQRALGFCPECGTAIYGTGPTDRTYLSLRIGTSRQRRELAPGAQLWSESRIPWASDLTGLPAVQKQTGKPMPLASCELAPPAGDGASPSGG
jgi:hypothetical protein